MRQPWEVLRRIPERELGGKSAAPSTVSTYIYQVSTSLFSPLHIFVRTNVVS